MHILMTADTLGGVWTYTRELATALVRSGVRVTVVSFGEIPTPEQVRWMEGLESLDHRPTGFRLEWMQDSEEDLAASAEYLRMVIDEVKPDLLHFNQFYYGRLETEQPKIVVAHSDVISWWRAVHRTGPKDTEWATWYRDAVMSGLDGADAVVAPSHAAATSIAANFIEPKRLVVVPNGRSPELWNPFTDKEPYLVSAGRIWDAGKNAALLTKIDLPWPLHLAGDHQHPEKSVNATAVHLGSARLIFKGILSEAKLAALYAGASAYIATSQYEPFGLAPLEAALSRCAILASDIPTFKEIWGEDAIYFKSNDPSDLEARLFELCSSPAMLKEYGNRAFNRARQRYTASRMAAHYVELYRSLVPQEVVAA
jgi:glycogen synthase